MADYGLEDGGKPTTRDDFIKTALKRFKESADASAPLRKKMLEDKRFFAGEQWNPAQKKEREELDLPCLVINRLKQPKRQITNGLMSSRPGIQINAEDNGADVETAQAVQGLTRSIERQSHADVVYGTAADDAVVCGRGYFKIETQWADDDQPNPKDPQGFFRREIRLKRVRNPFVIYEDPLCQEIDYRDARYYFEIDDVPIDAYRDRYPDSDACNTNTWYGVGNEWPDWLNEKTIRIANYWYVETEPVTYALLQVPTIDEATGQPGTPETVILEKRRGQKWPEGVIEIDTRPGVKRRVKWACINALEVLEGNERKTAGRDWAGRWIPIVPVLGEEMDIGGRVDLRGIVRDAMDGQRVQNYEVSDLIEKQMLGSRTPWIMAEGQDEGHQDQWNEANRKRFAYLTYKPTSLGQNLNPPPQRNNFEPAIQATVVGIQQSADWIMATTGYHEPSLGMQGPQESGKAIMARQRQGEIGSSNYAVSLSNAIKFGAEIIVDLIPHHYDASRVARILGPDDQERKVVIHNGQPPTDEERAAYEAQGISIYDISTGRYDVAVSVGTSRETQRQEANEMLTTAMQAVPQMWSIAGDLYWEFVDLPVARKLSERFKLMLDPRIQQGMDGKEPDAKLLQAQLQQMQQQMQQMQQAGQQLQQQLETKQVETKAKADTEIAIAQAKLATEERLAALEADTKIKVAEIQTNATLIATQAKLNAEASQARLEASLDQIAKELDYQRQERTAGRQDARADHQQRRAEQREDQQRMEDRESAAEDQAEGA